LNHCGCCSAIAALILLGSAAGFPLAAKAADGSERELGMARSAPPRGAANYRPAAALLKPVRLAQAAAVSGSGNATANDVISERGFWQGVPIADHIEVPPTANARVTAAPASPPPPAAANPSARRPIAAASAGSKPAPWPLAGRKDPEQFPNALSYAAQPSPMATRALQTSPTKPHAAAHGDTTVVVKHSDDRAPAASPRNEAALTAAPPAPSAKKRGAGLVRVGDRFNDPWMRAFIVTPSAQDYMETTLFGTPDFRNLSLYLEKPATAVSVAFADDPHPGMATDRFAGNPISFVSTVPFGAARAPSR
jgi:hypothetical protein